MPANPDTQTGVVRGCGQALLDDGRRLMAEAESRLREKGCPKICLQVRSANTAVIGFYKKLGFTLDDVVSLGKRLESDG